MKISDKITFKILDDSVVIITPWNNSIHILEYIAKDIFIMIIENKDKNYIISKIFKEYEIKKNIIEKDYEEFINELVFKKILI